MSSVYQCWLNSHYRLVIEKHNEQVDKNRYVLMCPFLEEKRLKNELEVCYERPELRKVSGAVMLLNLILGNKLHCVFPEITILLKILITMPMSTSEAERCFSMLKRIKTFLRNTMKEEKLTALGMLSCEKTFVSKIDNFNKDVMDLFSSQKNRRMDFIYHS
ncbi:hypothetical protein C0J52_15518 [Blattella germanica]|nr:hypothetical protein C0J52_15518 [Blattella germanica]